MFKESTAKGEVSELRHEPALRKGSKSCSKEKELVKNLAEFYAVHSGTSLRLVWWGQRA